jgi:hypothetical protein
VQLADAGQAGDRSRRTVLAARLAGFEADYASGVITGRQLQKAISVVTAELAEVIDLTEGTAVDGVPARPTVTARYVVASRHRDVHHRVLRGLQQHERELP